MVQKEKNTLGDGTWMKLGIIGLVQLKLATRFAEESHCSYPPRGTLAW
jgi:hypothetical protein